MRKFREKIIKIKLFIFGGQESGEDWCRVIQPLWERLYYRYFWKSKPDGEYNRENEQQNS